MADTYLARPVALEQARRRRLFTFATPLYVVFMSELEPDPDDPPTAPEKPIRIRAFAAEGVEDDGGDETQAFLALDVLLDEIGIAWTRQSAIGIYVLRQNIVGEQVQAPSLRPPQRILGEEVARG